MPRDLPDLQEGDELSADWLNGLRDLYLSAQITVDASGGLSASRGHHGTSITLADDGGFWAKLTYHGSGGAYSWLEQVPAPSGAWDDGSRGGYASGDPANTGGEPADPAIEANGNAAVPADAIAWCERDKAVGRITFQYDACP